MILECESHLEKGGKVVISNIVHDMVKEFFDFTEVKEKDEPDAHGHAP